MSERIRILLALVALQSAPGLLAAAAATAPDVAPPAAATLRFTCRERTAVQVGVADDGRVSPEPTGVRGTLSLQVQVAPDGGPEGSRTRIVQEEIGDTWRQLEGTVGPGTEINADLGHWLLEPETGVLRRVEAVAGRSARFVIYGCQAQ